MRKMIGRLRRPRAGFTLVELMVAIALGVMIMTIVAIVFAQSSEVFNDTTARLEALQNARALMDLMERDLSSAFLDGRGHAFLAARDAATVFPGVGHAPAAPAAIASTDIVCFATTAPGASGARVCYYLAAPPSAGYHAAALRVMRAVDATHTTDLSPVPGYQWTIAPSATAMAAFGVRSLTLRYLDRTDADAINGRPGRWVETWDAASARRLPAAVMVRAEVIDRKGRLNANNPVTPRRQPVTIERVIPIPGSGAGN